jgi:hypothetical protein
MSQENLAVIREFSEAWNRNNWVAMQVLSPGCRLDCSPRVAGGG